MQNNVQTGTELKTEPKTTFDIPTYNLPTLEGKIAKLNKRGAKIGCEPIRIITLKSWNKVLYDDHDNYQSVGRQVAQTIPMVTITIEGKAPMLNGWTLVSVVEPVSAGVLLRKFPGVVLEIPLEFRNVTPDRCDHCNTKRQRNETFIVFHEQEGWKVVGRTCLADFTGCSNPERIADYCSALFNLTLEAEDCETIGNGGNYGYYTAPLRGFLQMVVLWSNKNGFISSTQAKKHNEEHGGESYITPTGKEVFETFFNPSGFQYKAALVKSFNASVTEIEDEAAAEMVDAAMQWGKTQFVDANEDTLSDYGHNMKLLLAENRVRVIDVGFVASVVSGYKRSLVPKFEKIVGKNFVGTIGEKLITNVTVRRVYEYSGQYGITQITTMTDDDGNVIVWFAPEKMKLTVGKYVTMTCKVKSHNDRNGEKTTTVTYPRFM